MYSYEREIMCYFPGDIHTREQLRFDLLFLTNCSFKEFHILWIDVRKWFPIKGDIFEDVGMNFVCLF